MLHTEELFDFTCKSDSGKNFKSIDLGNYLYGERRGAFFNRIAEAKIQHKTEGYLLTRQIVREILNEITYELKNQRGALHKRFKSAAHKRGFTLTEEVFAAIGGVVGDALKDNEKPALIEFADTIWWESNDFGQSNSCWWNSRKEARDMHTDNGGVAILEYKQSTITSCQPRFTIDRDDSVNMWAVYQDSEFSETYPSARFSFQMASEMAERLNEKYPPIPKEITVNAKFGRAWVMPYTIHKGTEIQVYVVFNGYGRSTMSYAGILQMYLRNTTGKDWVTKSVSLFNNGESEGTYWINNAKGYVVCLSSDLPFVDSSIDFQLDADDVESDPEDDPDLRYCEDSEDWRHVNDCYMCEITDEYYA